MVDKNLVEGGQTVVSSAALDGLANRTQVNYFSSTQKKDYTYKAHNFQEQVNPAG